MHALAPAHQEVLADVCQGDLQCSALCVLHLPRRKHDLCSCWQVAEETIANDEVTVIKGGKSGRAISVLLRGANDYMLDEMDRSMHDSFCVVKRVLESGAVVPGDLPSSLNAICIAAKKDQAPGSPQDSWYFA